MYLARVGTAVGTDTGPVGPWRCRSRHAGVSARFLCLRIKVSYGRLNFPRGNFSYSHDSVMLENSGGAVRLLESSSA